MIANSSIQGFDNPVLHYRLDLGEPGIPAPSRASQSIIRVASHELQNVRRFERKAVREGGIVVHRGIRLSLSHRGSYLAAIGGHAEARIIYPGGRQGCFDQTQDRPQENPLISDQTESFNEALENPGNIANDLLSTLARQSTIAELQGEKAKLERELRQTQTDTLPLMGEASQRSSIPANALEPGPEDQRFPFPSSPNHAIQQYYIQQKIQRIGQQITDLTFQRQSKKADPSRDPFCRASTKDPVVESVFLDVVV
jgi:hypothetical protein